MKSLKTPPPRPPAPPMLLVLLESHQQVWVHQGGFAMFKPTLHKLFYFE